MRNEKINKVKNKMNKKAMGPAYTTQEQQKGLAPLTEDNPTSGYIYALYPIRELLKDPKLESGITEILKSLQEKHGISVDISQLHMFQVLDPSHVFNVNGNPLVYLDADRRVRQTNKVKRTVTVGAKYVNLSTGEIVDGPELDPATKNYDAVIRKMQENSAEMINKYLAATHNKLKEYVCSKGNPPLQNVRAMLLSAINKMQTRIAELEMQKKGFAQPRQIPERAMGVVSDSLKMVGINPGQRGEIELDPNFNPEKIINDAQTLFSTLINNYWDTPESLISISESGKLSNHFKKIFPTFSEEQIHDVEKALIDVMRVVHRDWEEYRAKAEAQIARREQERTEKNKEKTPGEEPGSSTEETKQGFRDYAIKKIIQVTPDHIRSSILYPQKFRGFRAYQEQGEAATDSIQRTEINTMNRSLEAAKKLSKWLAKKSSYLRSKNLTLSIKNFSPSDKATLCQLGEDLKKFTEGYARPIFNQKGEFDKSKMGVNEKPMANLLAADYLSHCHAVISKIACEGAAEDISLLCGMIDNQENTDTETEVG